MAYTIVKSDGTILTTIADGTINTSSTSLGLPGRNYAGYGQILDTNFVHQLENYASSTPPANPLRGQLWYDTNSSTLKVCPTDGQTNGALWAVLTSTASGGVTTFGTVDVSGNITANNIQVDNDIVGNTITVNFATVTANANISNAAITNANIGTTRTTVITTGANTTAGSITGLWTFQGGPGGAGGNGIILDRGGIYINNAGNLYGIKTDRYMYANGAPVSFEGTYSNANVAGYLPTYTGNIGVVGGTSKFNGNVLSTGSNSAVGTITGNWTLSSGSRLNATYADLAERFESDQPYEYGTVVELGGSKEVTAVKSELSESVFGVVSDTAGYLMNAMAGDDNTHPPITVSGRVKVKVLGFVTKGQRLVSAGNGVARGAKDNEATAFNVIGRALVDKTSEDVESILAVVMMR